MDVAEKISKVLDGVLEGYPEGRTHTHAPTPTPTHKHKHTRTPTHTHARPHPQPHTHAHASTRTHAQVRTVNDNPVAPIRMVSVTVAGAVKP